VEAGVKRIFSFVIVRFGGELWIKKSWTRRLYERRLVKNIKAALKRHEIPYEGIVRRHARLFLRTGSTTEASHRLAKVFGVSSVSPALEVGSSRLDDLVNATTLLAGHKLKEGNSFAVRCRRVGNHLFSSADVCKKVGRHILDEFGEKLGLKVKLKDPDVRFGVEVRGDEAFVFSEVVAGVGGLPLGTQPRVVSLLSGGVNSGVACWLVMKRGCPFVPVHFDNSPYTNKVITERVLEITKALFDWASGFPQKIYVVAHGENLKEIIENCPRTLTCLLCKRMMYRVAERLADSVGAEGLVTGETLGEKATQTPTDLRVLSQAAQKYPIHRPLLGFDKTETERMAREIGTYVVSSGKARECTAAPRKPATAIKIDEVLEAEKKLKIEEMVERAFHSSRTSILEAGKK
jgi:thiamine biosynthesis protein ThiI